MIEITPVTIATIGTILNGHKTIEHIPDTKEIFTIAVVDIDFIILLLLDCLYKLLFLSGLHLYRIILLYLVSVVGRKDDV